MNEDVVNSILKWLSDELSSGSLAGSILGIICLIFVFGVMGFIFWAAARANHESINKEKDEES